MPSSAVMGKWKAGELHSGGPGGPIVRKRSQAIAIKMSEQRKEAAHGGHYPEGGAMREVASRRRKKRKGG